MALMPSLPTEELDMPIGTEDMAIMHATTTATMIKALWGDGSEALMEVGLV
jgi:hypothetical protein